MKTLSQIIKEAEERFEKEFIIVQARNKGGAKFQPVLYYKNDMQFNLDGIKNFLKTELENIVKESFKNTRVEEITSTPQGRDERDAYNEALKNIKDTQNQFLNN